jgi:hypothetical protein
MTYHQVLVKAILEHPGGFDWSLQGFGMLRTYLTPEIRLHVWDSRYKVENVSTLHTHPWHFHSYVVAGYVVNQRFIKGDEWRSPANYREQEILCGPGGHETDKSSNVFLWQGVKERYGEGDSYTQKAHEIHESTPEDGTVTIVRREFLEDADHAFVYIPIGEEWVSAEPRKAKKAEVQDICQYALTAWFGDA